MQSTDVGALRNSDKKKQENCPVEEWNSGTVDHRQWHNGTVAQWPQWISDSSTVEQFGCKTETPPSQSVLI